MKPCNCVSSCVHPECLQRWNIQRSVGRRMTQCEVCKVPYWGSKWRLFFVMIMVWVCNVIKQLFTNVLYVFTDCSDIR